MADFDLSSRAITAASLSDILRVFLLYEFGGVWADATLYCNRPLDDWLPEVMAEGFFAFERPGPDRPLSSWFLASEPRHALLAAWALATRDYWAERAQADHYFWFHRLFQGICDGDSRLAEEWRRVPKVLADGPSRIYRLGMLSSATKNAGSVDWSVPVFKLTHRYDPAAIGPDTLLGRLVGNKKLGKAETGSTTPSKEAAFAPSRIASLSVSTENLGDHVQILANLDLLSRFGLRPRTYLDRDFELGSAPGLEGTADYLILLNGWFKRGSAEWPPNKRTPSAILWLPRTASSIASTIVGGEPCLLSAAAADRVPRQLHREPPALTRN